MCSQVLLADGADVAERVHRRARRRGSSASGASPGRRPGNSKRCTAKRADLLIRQAQPHRHAVEAAAREDDAPRVVEFIGIDQAERGQALQRVVEIRHLLADQLQLVGGLVVGQHLAVAVEDQAAAGRDRLERAPGCPATARSSSRGAAPAGRPGAPSSASISSADDAPCAPSARCEKSAARSSDP